MTAFPRLLVAMILIAASWDTAGSESQRESFHFAYDVAPVLAKAGCSAAECHGGAAGKGGFKLSLFSSDPRADFTAITRELGARRIDFVAPENSLFLRKPSRQLKHGGGRVLRTSDPLFQALRNWIASGSPWTSGPSNKLTSLRLESKDDRVTATAEFRTGDRLLERDVTDLAMLTSTNESAATVDANGRLTKNGPGESWILARYGHFNARLPVLSRFSQLSQPERKSDHALDAAWLNRLNALGLTPAGSAPENEMIRRLYFDLAGRPPSPLEMKQFSSVPETTDALLDSYDFALTWAGHLGNWFEVPIAERDSRNGKEANKKLRRFFRESMVKHESAAGIARQVLLEETPQLAWKRFSDPRDRAEFVGRTMLGMRIGCARCHNHPLDRWTRDEHLRFSAFFSDDRPNPDGGPMMAGRMFEPETGRAVTPALLPLTSGSPPPKRSRNEQIAWFVLDGDHDQFARNIANRVFETLTGRPLVDTVDDHRLSNPAIHEPVLDLLTAEFVANEYDLRNLIRLIVTSDLYALSSEPGASAGSEQPASLKYLARRESRRLSAHQYRRAVGFVTGVQLDHPLPPDSPLAEQLFIMNSGLIQKALASPGNQIDALFDFGSGPEQILEDLFLTILSRPVKDSERKTFLLELTPSENLRSRGKDLAFALLSSREFGSIR